MTSSLPFLLLKKIGQLEQNKSQRQNKTNQIFNNNKNSKQKYYSLGSEISLKLGKAINKTNKQQSIYFIAFYMINRSHDQS